MKGHFKYIALQILLILALLFLFSCSAKFKLARLVHNNPELIRTDTAVVHDTLIIPSVHTDTLIRVEALIDTVIITKDNLIIKTIIVNDSIFIEGECISDTIIREIKVPYEVIVVEELTFWESHRSWIIPLVVMMLIVGILRKVKII